MRKTHVSDKKKKEVNQLKELMNKYKVVGIIDLTGMPSPQLQKMRKKLKDSLIKVTKKRLIKLALDDVKESKKNIDELKDLMSKNVMPCLILTNEDSFKLAKVLRKAKTNVAAKAGQIAPSDIMIKAGPTAFPPGPIIGEFGALGIKTAVENGKIAIKDDKLIVKEGEAINNKIADVLMKLKVEPMQIGLNLIATYDNGVIFKKNVLDVDDKWYVDTIKLIANNGFKLAIQTNYLCKETIEFLIGKAEREAKAVNSNRKKTLEDKKIEAIEALGKSEVKKERSEDERRELLKELEKTPLEEKKPSAQEILNEVDKVGK